MVRFHGAVFRRGGETPSMREHEHTLGARGWRLQPFHGQRDGLPKPHLLTEDGLPVTEERRLGPRRIRVESDRRELVAELVVGIPPDDPPPPGAITGVYEPYKLYRLPNGLCQVLEPYFAYFYLPANPTYCLRLAAAMPHLGTSNGVFLDGHVAPITRGSIQAYSTNPVWGLPWSR